MSIYIAYCKSNCRGSAAIIIIFWAIRCFFEMSPSPSVMLQDCLSPTIVSLETTELHIIGKPQANDNRVNKCYPYQQNLCHKEPINHLVRPAHNLQGLKNCLDQRFSQQLIC